MEAKKLYEYTLDELGQELAESSLLFSTTNKDAQIVDFKTAVKQCDGISAEEFLNMWIQDIKEVGKEMVIINSESGK